LFKSLIPQPLLIIIRKIVAFNLKFVCEKSSLGMSLGMVGWLVGPVKRFVVKQDQTTSWISGVKLEKCRYLTEAKCKSACIHLCKAPTEEFFNKELGIPLYMKPDFVSQSCEFHFGTPPPSIHEDPAYKESCYETCSIMNMNKRLTLLPSITIDGRQNSSSVADPNRSRRGNDSLHRLP
jgi:hypothetical protein